MGHFCPPGSGSTALDRKTACLTQKLFFLCVQIRYPCDSCDSTFINNSRLKHHKQAVHNGLRFTCQRHTLDVMNSKTMKKVGKEACRTIVAVIRVWTRRIRYLHFGSDVQPKLFLSALPLAPQIPFAAPASAQDSFVRYLENRLF